MALLTADDLKRLSAAEKLELIAQLWDSLDNKDDALPPAHLAELDRRLETFESDIKDAVTWEQFQTRLANPPA